MIGRSYWERPARIRPAVEQDVPAIATLANSRQLPYQPLTTEAAVLSAMNGRSHTDEWWWERLGQVDTFVAEDRRGQVVGACSYAVDLKDNTGYLLWFATVDRYSVVKSLTLHALTALGACPVVRAYWFATPLSLGLEGLPAGLLPETDNALRDCGLTGCDLWLWMATDNLPAECSAVADVRDTPTGWRLEVDSGGDRPDGEAEIGCYGDLGVLWWISVDEGARRRGLGRRLLTQALATLAKYGARSVMLFVDHDDPAKRDRRPAIALYKSMGFQVIDHLFSYESTIR